jgi:murein DD-endopeptidase MepM/ murein hydrolase activator NlpD
MSELPQATSRRELREWEQTIRTSRGRAIAARQRRASRAKPAEKAARSSTNVAAARRPAGSRARTIGSRLLSVAAMIFAGVLAVGMSVPANAFFPASSDTTSTLAASSSTGGQSVAVSGADSVETGVRDKVQVLSWAQVLAQKYSHAGARVGGAGNGPIRWPFPYSVSISSGFGPRVAPCNGCSTFHDGVDLVPGDKAAIFAVTGGVVTERDDGLSGLGNYAVITSKIGGHTVQFTYGHMTTASSPLVLGQKVEVGDFVGLVGETGEATGPHLHLGLVLDGKLIDPIPWLEAHAGAN